MNDDKHSKNKLDQCELELEKVFENNEFSEIDDEEELHLLQSAAKQHIRKTERINVRLSRYDMDGLKRLASEEGIPYQTLLGSIIHKYVTGRLVDRSLLNNLGLT